MIDIAGQLTATYREVASGPADSAADGVPDGDTGTALGVLLRRRYPRDIGEVWSAVTEPKHLQRWFGPVRGCRRRDGGFEIGARAGGHVLHREPVHLFQFTWRAENTENTAVVTVRMAPDENADTIVELSHSVRVPEPGTPEAGAEPTERFPALATALTEGTTWDITFLALQHYLDGSEIEDPAGWRRSLAVQKFAQHSVSAWSAAGEASGIIPPPTTGGGPGDEDPVGEAVRDCLRRFAPDLTG